MLHESDPLSTATLITSCVYKASVRRTNKIGIFYFVSFVCFVLSLSFVTATRDAALTQPKASALQYRK